MYFFMDLKRKKKMIFGFLAVILTYVMLTTSTIKSEAADFKHNHTGACYTQGTGPCSAAHKTSTRTTGTTAHCSNCGTQTSHTMYVYWDKCYGTGQETELGGYRNCGKCGSQSYSWGSSSAGTHMVSQQVISCGKSTASTGSLWLKNSVSGWTTEGVTLEAGVDIYSSELSLPGEPYSWDNQASWTAETSKEITENGTYTIYAKSSNGAVVAETINVTNIDRTGPSLSGVDMSTTDWTNQDVVLTFHGEDSQPGGGIGSGLAAQAYSFDGGATYTEENCLTVSGNGTYEVMLMDQLGNVGHGQVEVTNIDKSAPEITGILPMQEGWQPESVMMQIQAGDAEDGCGLHNDAYSLDGGVTWQAEPEFLIAENGQYQVCVRDILGNTAVQDFTVNQIDVTAPVIENLEVAQDKIYTDKVFITILAKDNQPDGSEGTGLHNDAYSIDGGETWQTENTFWVEKGQIYDIRVRDALEWTSEEYIVERKDFPYPPPVVDNSNTSGGNTKPSDNPEESLEEDPQEAEEIKEQPKEEASKAAVDAPIGSGNGMYEFGNWYAHRDDNLVTDKDDSDSGNFMDDAIKKTESFFLNENASNQDKTVQVVRMPWYTTPVGKTVIVSASTLAVGSAIGGVFLLFLFSVPVYCVAEKGTLIKLGRVFLHRTKEGYSVYLSEFMLQAAVVPRYRIKVSRLLLKRVENARLLVESDEKNLEVLLQETIDFEL